MNNFKKIVFVLFLFLNNLLFADASFYTAKRCYLFLKEVLINETPFNLLKYDELKTLKSADVPLNSLEGRIVAIEKATGEDFRKIIETTPSLLRSVRMFKAEKGQTEREVEALSEVLSKKITEKFPFWKQINPFLLSKEIDAETEVQMKKELLATGLKVFLQKRNLLKKGTLLEKSLDVARSKIVRTPAYIYLNYLFWMNAGPGVLLPSASKINFSRNLMATHIEKGEKGVLDFLEKNLRSKVKARILWQKTRTVVLFSSVVTGYMYLNFVGEEIRETSPYPSEEAKIFEKSISGVLSASEEIELRMNEVLPQKGETLCDKMTESWIEDVIALKNRRPTPAEIKAARDEEPLCQD